MAEIVISEFMDEAAVADLRASFDVLYDKTLVDRPEELAAAAAGCRALIVRNRTQVRGALLEGAHLRVVGRLGVGLDNIDCKACRERGIAVIPATGANNTAVAEYVLAGLLMLALEILYYLVEHTYDLKIAGILRAQGEARQFQQRLAGGFALRQQAAPLLSKLRDAAGELVYASRAARAGDCDFNGTHIVFLLGFRGGNVAWATLLRLNCTDWIDKI